jgi:hypothetical protein
MQVIEQKGDKHDNVEQAQDALSGLSHMPGFVMGYVDESDNRPVMFFMDFHPGQVLARGQRSRTLVFAHRPEVKSDLSLLVPIGEAIANSKDMRKG